MLDQALDFYAWHIANTVPLVDIPGNLEWTKPFEFDGPLGGLLVIVFTGFVILPLIQLARLVLAGGELPYDGAVVRALGEHEGNRRMTQARASGSSSRWSGRRSRLRSSSGAVTNELGT